MPRNQRQLRRKRVLGLQCLENRRLLAGTPQLLADINPGAGGSAPIFGTQLERAEFVAVNGGVVFPAANSEHGTELWRTEGNETTTEVIDARPGSSGLHPERLMRIGDIVFFMGTTSDAGAELWKTDGTEEGTTLVKDINPGEHDTVCLIWCPQQPTAPNSSFPQNLSDVNGTLYFRATDAINGWSLWKSDGTAQGTVLVHDVEPSMDVSSGSISDLRLEMVDIEGTVFFTGRDGSTGAEIWKSDGSEAGTTIVADIAAGELGSHPQNLTAFDGKLYFATYGGMWVSEGDAASTRLFAPPESGRRGFFPLAQSDRHLFFVSNGEPWITDGTFEGTQLIKDIRPGGENSMIARSIPNEGVVIGDTLFFVPDDGVHGAELWKSDGTEVGTMLVKDIYAGSPGALPKNLIAVEETLYFTANDGVHGEELWMSDGSAQGTVMVADIRPGEDAAFPRYDLTATLYHDGRLFFWANDGVHGREPWVLELPAGDTDGDLNVDPTDLVRIINNAGRIDEDAMWSQGDFDVDDMVTFKDLLQTAEELGFPVANEIEHFDRLGLMTYLIEDILGTWLGDANLDGRVDFGDFATLATNFGSQQASWSAGDFDGDGTVGFSDFVLLADNYGREN